MSKKKLHKADFSNWLSGNYDIDDDNENVKDSKDDGSVMIPKELQGLLNRKALKKSKADADGHKKHKKVPLNDNGIPYGEEDLIKGKHDIAKHKDETTKPAWLRKDLSKFDLSPKEKKNLENKFSKPDLLMPAEANRPGGLAAGMPVDKSADAISHVLSNIEERTGFFATGITLTSKSDLAETIKLTPSRDGNKIVAFNLSCDPACFIDPDTLQTLAKILQILKRYTENSEECNVHISIR